MRVNTQYPINSSSLYVTSKRNLSDELLDWDIHPNLGRRQVQPLLTELAKRSFPGNNSLNLAAQNEINQYFDDASDKRKILQGIDLIWRNEYLFSTDFQDYLLSKLGVIMDENEYFLSEIKNPKNPKKLMSCYGEYQRLLGNTKLTKTQKLLAATQAIELAFIGSNPTETLRNINAAGAGSKGFRNELFAGWYLVKFILGAKSSSYHKAVHSLMLPTYHTVKRENNRKERIKLEKPFVREIDIVTYDSLSSVKSSGNHFSDQILDLFFVVADSSRINPLAKDDLANQIRKLFLFRSSRDIKELAFNYRQGGEYFQLKQDVIKLCKIEIEKLCPYESQSMRFRNLVKNLILSSGMEIYFMPYIGSDDPRQREDWLNNFHLWLRENYEVYDSRKIAC